MLVGTRSIPSTLIKEAKTVGALKKLAEKQVPLMFRHVKEIVDNQKYLLALQVRKLYKHDYNVWHPLCEGLLEGVHVTGSIHTLHTCAELLSECDVNIMENYIDKEVH